MAVPLPGDAAGVVREVVASVQREVERSATAPRSAVRWVRLDGLHLTLRFLGPTPVDRVTPTAAALARAATGHGAFRVSVRGSGAFPSPSRPRTVWLGVVDPDGGLERLAAAVHDELVGAGWPADTRPFRPHLTLARADGRREGPLVADVLARHARDLDLRFEVDRVVLFESVTGGGPARYVPLHEVPLDG